MTKDREPYYWSVARIVHEYKLIENKQSELTSGQCQAVKYIYELKQRRGLLPGQLATLRYDMDASLKAAKGCIESIVRDMGADPEKVVMSNFTLVVLEPEKKEIARYGLSFVGEFIGWILVFKEGNNYIARYYVENPE